MATTEKKTRGKWKTGESGNPNGRPPGVGEVTKLRNSIAEHLPEIITQLVNRAREGDIQAARLLLERTLPPMKPVEQPVELTLPDNEGLSGLGMAIVQAVAAGTLTPTQAAALLAGLGTLVRLDEFDEQKRRKAERKAIIDQVSADDLLRQLDESS